MQTPDPDLDELRTAGRWVKLWLRAYTVAQEEHEAQEVREEQGAQAARELGSPGRESRFLRICRRFESAMRRHDRSWEAAHLDALMADHLAPAERNSLHAAGTQTPHSIGRFPS